MNRLLDQLLAAWRAMSAPQRIALLSIALLTLGSAALLMRFASEPQYGTLYSELSPDDAGAIVDRLASDSVPYKLASAGTTVLVPVDRIYDLRLELATQGLPSSGPVGFEVFSERGLSMTPFEQRVQFRRALEGELARTISRLDGVQWVRVHISIPDRAAFQRERKPPTAAVVMSLKAGRELRGSEAAGIAHLISGAVEGLPSDQVTILDSKGRVLAKPGATDDDALAGEAFDVQRRLELELAARAQRLLDAALGPGKSVVTIAAQIDRRKFEERQERVNPDESAVVSEQRSEETRSAPGELFGGVPGTPSNVPGGLPAEAAPAEPSRENVTRETINFDFSKSTSQTVVPMGGLQRLSIAVLVDGLYEAPPQPAGEAQPEGEEPAPAEPVYKPRGEEELQQLRDLVMRAVGFQADRGDVIEVKNLRFRPEERELAAPAQGFFDRPELYFLLPAVIKAIALVGGLALLALLVLRPALQRLATLPLPPAAGAGPAGVAGAAPVPLADPAAELAIPVSKDQARQVAEAMRQWLRE